VFGWRHTMLLPEACPPDCCAVGPPRAAAGLAVAARHCDFRCSHAGCRASFGGAYCPGRQGGYEHLLNCFIFIFSESLS
jgi:hypothetical protein